MAILFVALGGALGASLRYLSVGWAVRAFGTAFPYGTLIVNVGGSLAMGVMAAYFLSRGHGMPTSLAYFTLTGVLGGFTTFSAFSLDALLLMEEGRALAAMAYVVLSMALSIGALFIGISMARTVLS